MLRTELSPKRRKHVTSEMFGLGDVNANYHLKIRKKDDIGAMRKKTGGSYANDRVRRLDDWRWRAAIDSSGFRRTYSPNLLVHRGRVNELATLSRVAAISNGNLHPAQKPAGSF